MWLKLVFFKWIFHPFRSMFIPSGTQILTCVINLISLNRIIDCYWAINLDNIVSRVNSRLLRSDCLMVSPLVMSRLAWFSRGTQRVPLIRREWTWHHKSNGDSWATDHRGQSRAHRKCIPSPRSHCPRWCLFKLGSDTWRDYSSPQISSHSTLASNASLFQQQDRLGHWVLGDSNQTRPIPLPYVSPTLLLVSKPSSDWLTNWLTF